jgi:GxxExxY protein
MKVHGTLQPGLDEKLYENALIIELAKRGHRADQQKFFSVHYDGHFIGKMTPDVIVDDLVIVDPKVVETFHKDHLAQMLGYLSITGLELALLLNFKHASLEWKRIVSPALMRRVMTKLLLIRVNPCNPWLKFFKK